MKNKIYISSSLSGSKDLETAKKFYEKLADVCTNIGFDVFLPHRDSSDPVFDRDQAALRWSDIILVDLSEPSHGVGLELGEFASTKNVLAICVVSCQGISKYLQRFLDKHRIKVHYYWNQNEAIGFVKGYLTRLDEELGKNLK